MCRDYFCRKYFIFLCSFLFYQKYLKISNFSKALQKIEFFLSTNFSRKRLKIFEIRAKVDREKNFVFFFQKTIFFLTEIQHNKNIFFEATFYFYLDAFFEPNSKEFFEEQNHNIQKFLLKKNFSAVLTKLQSLFEVLSSKQLESLPVIEKSNFDILQDVSEPHHETEFFHTQKAFERMVETQKKQKQEIF